MLRLLFPPKVSSPEMGSSLPTLSVDVPEHLWKIYDTINEWIRFSDTKAGAILVANGIIATIGSQSVTQVNSFWGKHQVFTLTMIFALISLLLSTFNSLKCLMPITKLGKKDDEPSSLIFFAHIAQKYKVAQTYEGEVIQVFRDETQILTQLSQQVWANSQVANRKYSAVKWSFFWFAVMVGFIVVSLLSLVLQFLP